MTITIELTDAQLASLERRATAHNATLLEDGTPIDGAEYLRLRVLDIVTSYVNQDKEVGLQQLRAVGEQILAAPPEKQQAAIAAALEVIAA